MSIQFTGLASGLDTQSIVSDLMRVEHMKVESVEKEKTRLEWTKDAWSDINTKLYSFHKEELFALKTNGSYSKKNATSSNESVISVSDATQATNGVHSIEILSMAKGSFLTGSQLADGVSKTTTMADLAGISADVTLNFKTNTADSFDVSNEITVSATDTIADVLAKIEELDIDLNAGFDDEFRTLFLSSTKTGADVQVSATGNGDAAANSVLTALGLTLTGNDAVGSAGASAQFTYNGTTFDSDDNEISINGLNFNINASSGTSDIVVSTNTDAIYDMVKSFIGKYNELIVEMSVKLQADPARGYDPLTSDEKQSMTDEEIELWENKIKSSLLRSDTTLNSVRTDLRSMLTVSQGFDTSSLDFSYISELGIVTGDYQEKGMLHIEGDADDPLYADKDNKLREAIESDLDGLTDFLTGLGQHIYDSMYDKMKSSTISSSLTFYNDKLMDDQMDDYDDEIARLEERLAAVESRYYKQFTAMEQAIQESNSTGNWLAQQLSAL